MVLRMVVEVPRSFFVPLMTSQLVRTGRTQASAPNAAGMDFRLNPSPPPLPRLSDALRVTTSPTLRALAEAVLQAARAVIHADWQRSTAAAALAQQPVEQVGVPSPSDADVIMGTAAVSLRSNLVTLEALLAAWLAHAIAFPALPPATDVEAFVAIPAVSAACRISPFAATLLQRLREM